MKKFLLIATSDGWTHVFAGRDAAILAAREMKRSRGGVGEYRVKSLVTGRDVFNTASEGR